MTVADPAPLGAGLPRAPGAARQRILDTARTLFSAHGFERTPLRAIADALGVTKAAVYHHFRAKDDLLVAIVAPVLDRIDDLVASAGSPVLACAAREGFLGRYVDELLRHADTVALLLRDPSVPDHPLGQRFTAQHARMRALLGEVDQPSSRIRTTIALRALELAVVDFAGADLAQVRDTALHIALAVLDAGPGGEGGAPA